MNTTPYEQVSFDSLPNRAGNAARFLGEVVTPDQAFIVLYPQNNGTWKNIEEHQNIEYAEAALNRLRKLNHVEGKIVLAVKALPVVEELPVAVAEQASVEIVEEPACATVAGDIEVVPVYSGKRIDMERTLLATVKMTTRPFTVEQVQDAIRAINPADGDIQFMAQKAPRILQSFSNRFAPSSCYVLNELSRGVYALR